MNIMRNFTIILLLLHNISTGIAQNDWGVEHLASNKNLANSYKDPELFKKMGSVFDYLKGSWCSEQKAKLIMEIIISEQLNTCVEIGACLGSSSLPILVALEHRKKGHAYLVDAWSNEEAVKGLPQDDPNALWWSTLDMNAVKNQLLHMLTQWKLESYCTVVHATSEQAVSRFDSIDFLLLDGTFSEAGSYLDSVLYVPKVRSGGYILLANVLVIVNQKPTKMKALWPLFDSCEIVSEIEHGNVFLFRKK